MGRMQTLKCAIALCGMLLPFVLLDAQDLHYSQFWMNAMSVNPATTGLIEGDVRAGLYSRTQWLSVTQPYQTNGIWAEAPVWKRKIQQDIFGAGFALDRDQAGDARYCTWRFNGFFSYSKSLNYKNNHFLSAGLMVGVSQKRLDLDRLTTDEQYWQGLFDPTMPSMENFPTDHFAYPDVGAGIRWFYKPGAACAFDAGCSVMHLNRPRHSLLHDDQIRLPMKYTATFQLNFPVSANVTLRPSCYYSLQDVHQEVLVGVLTAYSFHFDQKGYVNQWIAGLDYRLGDAVYVVTGLQWRKIQLQISYDFNVSRLSEASHGRGGMELSLMYVYKRPQLYRPHKMPCPIF